MSYEIKYDRDNPADWRKACCDLLQWWGRDFYKVVAKQALPNARDFDNFRSAVALLAGVEGFPVEAFWERYKR